MTGSIKNYFVGKLIEWNVVTTLQIHVGDRVANARVYRLENEFSKRKLIFRRRPYPACRYQNNTISTPRTVQRSGTRTFKMENWLRHLPATGRSLLLILYYTIRINGFADARRWKHLV